MTTATLELRTADALTLGRALELSEAIDALRAATSEAEIAERATRVRKLAWRLGAEGRTVHVTAHDEKRPGGALAWHKVVRSKTDSETGERISSVAREADVPVVDLVSLTVA